MTDLSRFHAAQDSLDAWNPGYERALDELRAGAKRSHWIWYVFPQLAGLGHSDMAVTYAIADRAEAEAYVRDKVLVARLVEIAGVVEKQLRRGAHLGVLMGSDIDATKLVSSMTLFAEVAAAMPEARRRGPCADIARVAGEVLTIAEAQGYPRCAITQAAVRR